MTAAMRARASHNRRVRVGQLLSRKLVAATPDQTLRDAAARMRDSGVSALIVVSDRVAIGIITEHDLTLAAAEGRDPSQARVGEFTTTGVEPIDIGMPATEAAATMKRRRIRHLAATDPGRPVGVVSARDLLGLEPAVRVDFPIGEPW